MHTLGKSDISAINRKIKSDKYNSIILKSKKNLDIYIVGGYVRDILLGREGPDRDYAIRGDYSNFLKNIASRVNGKIFTIGKKNFHRIALKNGLMLDFMPVDNNIEHDLSVRDFTINSLAWSPERGIIDLHNGIDDLVKKTIRMVKIENLQNDPVRIVRAYRFADELSFKIEPRTRNSLKMLRGLIKDVKTERISLEFFRILNSKDPVSTLRIMLEDGVLGILIYSYYNELRDNIKVIYKINKIINKLPLKYLRNLNKIFSHNLTYRGLIRLEVLLRGIPENLLNMSSIIHKRLRKLERTYHIEIKNNKRVPKKILYEIFSNAEEAAIDFLIINDLTSHINEMERYNAILKKGFLSTEKIIRISGLPEGKALGNVKELLKRAQFTKEITNKQEAYNFLKRLFP